MQVLRNLHSGFFCCECERELKEGESVLSENLDGQDLYYCRDCGIEELHKIEILLKE